MRGVTARQCQRILPTVDTPNRPWPTTSVAPRRAFLGRAARGSVAPRKVACRPAAEAISAVQGHRLAHRGGAAWSLPLSNRGWEWTPRRATLALAAALSSVRQCMHRQRMRQPFINDYVDIVIAIPKALVMHTLSSAARATGIARSTIYRAVKAGRLSAHKLTSGTYVIYPGELLRVFPLESSFSKTVAMAKLRGFGFPAWDVS